MNADTQSDVTDEMIEAAAAVGASPLYCAVVAISPESVEVRKNHAARELARTFNSTDGGRQEAIANHIERSGDYLTALFEGDLAEALYRSDATNRRILIRAFPEEYLLAALADDRGSRESARRWLGPEIERYGFGDE